AHDRRVAARDVSPLLGHRQDGGAGERAEGRAGADEDRDEMIEAAAPAEASLSDVFWYFLKLGWLAFGGPVGQIGLMHLECVERKKWISEDEFVRALNFCHVLPGPEATQ